MIETGEKQLVDAGEVDFFAKFGEDLTEDQQKANSYHIMALGHLGLGHTEKSKEFFSKSLDSDVNQLWSRIYMNEQ